MLLSTNKTIIGTSVNNAAGQGEQKVVQAQLATNLNNATLVSGTSNTVLDTIGTGNWKFYVAGNTSVASITSASASTEWTGGSLMPYVPPPTDYYLYYTLNSGPVSGNIITDSVSGNTATLMGGATISTSFSKFGAGSLYVNNTQSYSSGNSQHLKLPTITVSSSGFTVALWTYVTSSPSFPFFFDFSTATNGGSQGSNSMILRGDSGRYAFYPFLTNGTGDAIYTPGGTLSNNNWIHICITIATNKLIQIYVNSVSVYSGITAIDIFANNVKTESILGTTFFPDVGLKGYIDDFRIYNRAITSDEVSAVYVGLSKIKDAASGATWMPTSATPVDASETSYTVKSTEIALTPGTNSTFAVWTAPKSTNIHVDVSFADYHTRSAGVGFQIFKINSDNTFGSVLFPRTVTSTALTNAAPTNYLSVPLKTISVAAGDKIYYRIDANGNTTAASSVLATNIYTDNNYIPPLSATNINETKVAQAQLATNLNNASLVSGTANTVLDTIGTGNWKFYVAGNTSVASITSASASSEWTGGSLLTYNPSTALVLTDYLYFYNFSTSKVSGTTVYDVVGNYTGTLSGLASVAVDGNSRVPGQGYLKLNLSNGLTYMTFPTFTTPANGFSFSMWFYSNNTPDWGRLFQFGTVNSDRILASIHTSQIRLYTDGAGVVDTSYIPTNYTWYHFVWTFASNGTWIIYINGTSIYNSVKTYPPQNSRASNYLGNSPNGEYLTGGIDNFRYYNYVLSPSNVTSIYNSGDNDVSFPASLKDAASGATWVPTSATPVDASETSYTVKSTEIALTPGTNSTYAVWTAPKTTNIRLDVSFADYHSRSAGVGFQIFKINSNNTFGSVIFPRTVTSTALTDAAPTNYLSVPSKTISVTAGDKIYYRIDANGNTTSASSVLATNIYTDNNYIPPLSATNVNEQKVVQAQLATNLNNASLVSGTANTVLDTVGTGNWKFYVAGNTSVASISSASASTEWTGGSLLSYDSGNPLVFSYSFDTTTQIGSTVKNTTTNAYDLTLYSGAQIATASPAPYSSDNAGYLTMNVSSGQYAQSNATLSLSQPWTISYWFKHSGGSPNVSATMFEMGDSNLNAIRLSDNNVVASHTNGSQVETGANYSVYYNDTNWHHLCFVYSGGSISVYGDGVNTQNGTQNFNVTTNFTYFSFGKSYIFPNPTSGSWTMNFDKFNIFNTALSAGQVSSLYNNTFTIVINPTLKNAITGVTWKPLSATAVDSTETSYTVKSTEVALKPGTNSTYAVWTAPKTTNIRVDVSFADYHTRSAGVGFQIFKINSDNTFGSVLFPRTVTSTALTDVASTNYLTVPSVNLSVATGDKIYYRVDANGNTTAASSVLATNIYSYSGKWS